MSRSLHHLIAVSIVLSIINMATMAAHGQRIEGIYPERFQEYVKWLGLDESQQRIAQEMHRQYERDYDVEFLPVIREYTSKMIGIHEPGYEELRKAHADERAAIEAEMKRRDEAFFADLEALLRPDQIGRMKRVRYARQRQLLRTDRGELPEGNVDLGSLLVRLDLSRDEAPQVFEVLDWYEPQLIAALQKSWEVRPMHYVLFYRRSEVDRRWLEVVQLPSTERAAVREVEEALWRERQELLEQSARLKRGPGERLVELNRTGLLALKPVLSDENFRALERSYLEESYPEVYPDPASASVLYDAAERIESLDEGQRERVAAARADFEQLHNRMSAALAEAFMDRRRNARHGGANPPKPEAGHPQYIFDPGLKREALNARQIDVLRAILTPVQLSLLPEWDFKKNPAKRPWDYADEVRRTEAQRRAEEEKERRRQGLGRDQRP